MLLILNTCPHWFAPCRNRGPAHIPERERERGKRGVRCGRRAKPGARTAHLALSPRFAPEGRPQTPLFHHEDNVKIRANRQPLSANCELSRDRPRDNAKIHLRAGSPLAGTGGWPTSRNKNGREKGHLWGGPRAAPGGRPTSGLFLSLNESEGKRGVGPAGLGPAGPTPPPLFR